MKKPTVADLMAEIEALKRRVAELEGLKAKPQRDPLKDHLEEIKRQFERAEKERVTREPPPRPYYWPHWEPYWLQPQTVPHRDIWPPGTVLC